MLFRSIHRLARPILSRTREPPPGRFPELGHRALLADQHPRADPRRRGGEDRAALSGRNDVRPDVTEPANGRNIVEERKEPAMPAPRDILEKHALDRVDGTEVEDLVARRFDHVCHGRDPDV